MRIGVDFGTTNSGAAVFDGRRLHFVPLEPAGPLPAVIRSTLYVTRDGSISIGQQAIDDYYRQNAGRARRLTPRRVGEIELTFGAVDSVKGYPAGPETFIRDVYVMVDELEPGRLMRSLKSGLAGAAIETELLDRAYRLEELIALYLTELRRRVEADLGERVDGAVFGRPVHFVDSAGEANDQRAEGRLREAAALAGFDDVTFELEPVAAALYYNLATPGGATSSGPRHVLVFDFGGGTLDVTVMRFGRPGDERALATGGVGEAGDAFERRIMERLLLEHFGRGAMWGGELADDLLAARGDLGRRASPTPIDGPTAPFPDRYTDALVQWQTAVELERPEALQFLRRVQTSGSHPSRVRALESLVTRRAVLRLADEVERAKVTLCDALFAVIRLQEDDVDLWQPLTRLQFEALIGDVARRVERCVLETVARAGLAPEEIDVVVRTGGSAQIPLFAAMLGRLFGPDRVVAADPFSSVAAGLAIRAAASHGAPSTPGSRPDCGPGARPT